MRRKGFTMSEAAAESQESLPGAVVLCLEVTCTDGTRLNPVCPWTPDAHGRAKVRALSRECAARYGKVAQAVSPCVSYDRWQLPCLVRTDLEMGC